MSLTSKTNNQNVINFVVSKAISIFSLLYFISIPLGWTKTKFETDDIVILFIILLFNSELLEKLAKLVISKDGITLDLNQIKETQDNQQITIQANRSNIEALTNIVQRITSLEQQIAENKNDKELIAHSLLSEYELKHLEQLSSNQPFPYTKQRAFEQELRHLRAFGFIENLPGQTISGIAPTGDLRDYVKITQKGQDILSKKQQLEV
jgi:hypothetical protein